MNNQELFNSIKNANGNDFQNNYEELKEKIENKLCGKYKKIFYLKDEIISKEGKINNAIYFIEKGKVLLCKKDSAGKEFSCGYLTTGEFFDVSAYVGEGCPFTYKAISNCSIYVIDLNAVREMMEDERGRIYMIDQAIKVSRALKIRQGRLIMGGCKKTFINLIMEQFNEGGRCDSNGQVTITLDLNLTDIAIILNITRETLSRIVSEMKRDNIIMNKRKFIIINDLQKFVEAGK